MVWFKAYFLGTVSTLFIDGSELRPSSAQVQPGPVHFPRDHAGNFEKRPGYTQARPRLGIDFFEKGLENWDFYAVKNTGSSRLGIELL